MGPSPFSKFLDQESASVQARMCYHTCFVAILRHYHFEHDETGTITVASLMKFGLIDVSNFILLLGFSR